MKMRTTHRMKSDTFNGIFKLGAGLKKKKQKGKKKVEEFRKPCLLGWCGKHLGEAGMNGLGYWE